MDLHLQFLQYASMAWCLVKAEGQLYLYLFYFNVTKRKLLSVTAYGVLGFDSRRGQGISLHHRVRNGSGAHPASYPMGTRGSFPGSKAAGA
jgi:hypothetical protein